MIVVVNGENRRLFGSDLAQMFRQRKTVFVDGAGWGVRVIGDMEIDDYDREDTIYLLAKTHPDGPVLASVRLLTTTGPHLMGELFPAADRAGIPCGPTVWEASRFCAAPGICRRAARLALLWEIICGVMETSLLYGIDQVVFAANRALLPLALKSGWTARTLGPSYRDGTDEVTAAAALITPEGLRSVRQRHCAPVPVMRLPTSLPSMQPKGLQSRGTAESALGLPFGRGLGVHRGRASTGDPRHG